MRLLFALTALVLAAPAAAGPSVTYRGKATSLARVKARVTKSSITGPFRSGTLCGTEGRFTARR